MCLHEDFDVQRGITEWNVLQAILRRSAQTIDSCFLTMNTTVLATLLLTGVEVLHGKRSSLQPDRNDCCTYLKYGWALPQMFVVLYTVFRAATVTEKCSRVPALINSWMIEESQLYQGRQYIVQYITNS